MIRHPPGSTPLPSPALFRSDIGLPGHAGGPTVMRRRLEGGPVAPLKLASGCDRRCAFCAIPAFRGAFVSRRPSDVLAEAHRSEEHTSELQSRPYLVCRLLLE